MFASDYSKISFRPQKTQIRTSRKTKKTTEQIFVHKELATKVIMNCRTTAAHKFRARLGSNDMVSF